MIKLVDHYKNNHHHSIGQKPITTDYSALTEKFETNPKVAKFKVNDRVRITKYKNILIRVTLKIGQQKHLLSILYLKLILELRKLNGEKKKQKVFMKKNCF